MTDYPKTDYRLLIFDWDGTLVDSIERIVTSLQHASHEVCRLHVSDDVARSVIGLGLFEAIEKLHPELESVKIESIAAAYKQHFLYDNPVPAHLFDGVEDLLRQLLDDSYTLAIATGKSRIGLDQAMQEHQLGNYFVTTRCAGEMPSKPHPEMIHSILNELGTATDNALMIGDSEHDFKMAHNAGVEAIGVTHGVEDAESMQKHKLLACLDDVTDLYAFLSHNTQNSTIQPE